MGAYLRAKLYIYFGGKWIAITCGVEGGGAKETSAPEKAVVRACVRASCAD